MRGPSSRAAPRAALAFAAAIASACAGGSGGSLQAANPAQAVGGAPGEAQAELSGVTVQVLIGGWRGQPRDLEQRLTPVDVTIRDLSGKALVLGPEQFTLVSGSTRYTVLDSIGAERALRDLAGFRRAPPPSTGTRGTGSFPGYSGPPPTDPTIGMQPGQPVAAVGQWYAPQLISGQLENGRQTSFLLFFDVPARTLGDTTFEVVLRDDKGESLGVLQIPFSRVQ